jgi:hypothetical protein
MTSRLAASSQDTHAEPTQGATNADLVVGTLGAAVAKLPLPTKRSQATAAPLAATLSP